jgi:hypothetical protein
MSRSIHVIWVEEKWDDAGKTPAHAEVWEYETQGCGYKVGYLPWTEEDCKAWIDQ